MEIVGSYTLNYGRIVLSQTVSRSLFSFCEFARWETNQLRVSVFVEDVSIELTHGYHDLSQTVTLNKDYGHRVTFRGHSGQEVHVVRTRHGLRLAAAASVKWSIYFIMSMQTAALKVDFIF